MERPKIMMGIPIRKYFCMPYAKELPQIRSLIDCVNPKTGEITTGEYLSAFNYRWDEVPNSFFMLNFNSMRNEYRERLEDYQPEFRDKEKIRFLLLKKA